MGFFKKTPTSKKDREEYGPGKEDIVICPKCNASYYYKNWHHNLEDYEELDKNKNIEFKLCPADQMKSSGKFEGELTIRNVPPEVKDEIINQLENIADRAYRKDPMDRILQMHITDDRIEVRTSENQLALNMGRLVQRAHKNAESKVRLSEGESTARVRVWWPEK
ncbi:MAG: hypothetical protein R3251_02120 [Candidatus Spechtbacterales bacterium]|nr:hypothetical protein [Candidatus Spechtbacterales bacterium]